MEEVGEGPILLVPMLPQLEPPRLAGNGGALPLPSHVVPILLSLGSPCRPQKQ